MIFKKFEDHKIEALYDAFILAFMDNSVRFKPSFDQFSKRIFNKLRIEGNLSGLLVNEQDIILAFSLYTIEESEGVLTAYNGGVGVVPDQRRKGLARQLMEKTLSNLQKVGVNKVLLEVVTTNKPAIHLYESFGFGYKRQLKCFKTREMLKLNSEELEIKESVNLKPVYESFWTYPTTFLDSTNQLIYNLENEKILEAYQEEKLVGYVIFQPKTGRISQISVDEYYRNQGVGGYLLAAVQSLSEEKELTIMNIPEEQEPSIIALQKIGFKNEVDQYEMELII